MSLHKSLFIYSDEEEARPVTIHGKRVRHEQQYSQDSPPPLPSPPNLEIPNLRQSKHSVISNQNGDVQPAPLSTPSSRQSNNSPIPVSSLSMNTPKSHQSGYSFIRTTLAAHTQQAECTPAATEARLKSLESQGYFYWPYSSVLVVHKNVLLYQVLTFFCFSLPAEHEC